MKHGVVFDMDKCIGYFTQVAMYQDIIEELTRPLKVKEQFDLFDICREIFRPGIFNVFKYLAKEKKKKKLKIIMYTNNNGPPSWATNIRKYIEYKIKKKIFDRTIKGWKYDNKIIEKNRSGYAKTWKDLLVCARLNKNDKIIFFDDRDEHDGMKHKNVDYQKVKPYRVDMKHEVFVKRFMGSKLKKKLGYIEESILMERCKRSGYNPKLTSMEYSNNDIMKPLRKFLKKNKNKTRRRRGIKNKKTRKKRGGNGCSSPGLKWDQIDYNRHYNIYNCVNPNDENYNMLFNNIVTGRYRIDSKDENEGLLVVRMGDIGNDEATTEEEYGFAIDRHTIDDDELIKIFGPVDGGEEKRGV